MADLRRNSIVRRWARHAIAMAPDHPLLPLYWQLFFQLYFARAPLKGQTSKLNERGMFGYRFFEGDSGVKLLKEVRDRLAFLAGFLAKERLQKIQSKAQVGLVKCDYARLTDLLVAACRAICTDRCTSFRPCSAP